MSNLTKSMAIIKIRLLQNSTAKNYFETNERLFLSSIFSILENLPSEEITIDEKQIIKLEKIFEKYKKSV